MPEAAAERGARNRGDIAALLTRSAFAQVLGVVRNVVILPLLGPAQVGTFRLVQQLSSYSQHLSVGAFATLNVKYPEWEAAGETERCEAVHRMARNQSVLGTLLFIPIFAALVWSLSFSPALFVALCVTSGFPLLADFVGIVFNVRGEFGDVARIDIAVALIGLACLVAGAYVWGLAGALVAAALPPIVRVVLGRRTLVAAPGSNSWAETVRTFRFGFQVWIGSTLSNVAATLDLVLLGGILGDGSHLLGYYAVGLMVTQVLAQNLSAVTMVQQRALRRQIGELGGVGSDAVAVETRRLLGTDAFVGVVFAAVTISAAYLIFPTFLPAFVPALPGLGALLTSILLIKARVYTRVILTNADRPRLAMIAPIVQLASMAAVYPLVVSGESSVLALGLLRMGSFLLSSMLEVVIAYAVMGRAGRGAALAGQLVLGLVPTALGFIVVPHLLDHGAASTIGPLVAAVGSYVVYDAMFDGAAREGLRMLRQVLRRVARRRESPAPPR